MKRATYKKIAITLFCFLMLNHFFNFVNLGYHNSKSDVHHQSKTKIKKQLSNTFLLQKLDILLNIPQFDELNCSENTINCFEIKIKYEKVDIGISRFIPLIKYVPVDSKIQFETKKDGIEISSDLIFTGSNWYFGIYSAKEIEEEVYQEITAKINNIVREQVKSKFLVY